MLDCPSVYQDHMGHREFKNISGITVPMLFDRILRERPPVFANAVQVARKKLQARIEKVLSQEDRSPKPYLSGGFADMKTHLGNYQTLRVGDLYIETWF